MRLNSDNTFDEVGNMNSIIKRYMRIKRKRKLKKIKRLLISKLFFKKNNKYNK